MKKENCIGQQTVSKMSYNINSLKGENVINLFMAVFEEVNKVDLKVHNLCNSELDPVANLLEKAPY